MGIGIKMETQNTTGECEFDKLFGKSVPHILEKIFFSLDYASFKKCMEVAPAWREHLTSKYFKRLAKTTFREDIEGELWHNIYKDNEYEVKRILSSGMVDVNCTYGRSKITPLFWAAREGKKDMVRILLEEGAEVNRTVLRYALLPRYTEIANLLREYGGSE